MRSARKDNAMYEQIEAAVLGPLRDLPLLTIFGQFNDPLRFQPKWKKRFPSCRQVVIRHGNHFPMCDAPDTVAEAITSWHRTLVARAAA
jgi:haloalkane dehalogenase